MRLDKHPVIKKCYDVMQAIEMCGASIELTHAGTLAGQLGEDIDKLVDELNIQESINKLEILKIKKDDVLIFRCDNTSQNQDRIVKISEALKSYLSFEIILMVVDNNFYLEKISIDEFHRLMKVIEKKRGICNEDSETIEKDNG